MLLVLRGLLGDICYVAGRKCAVQQSGSETPYVIRSSSSLVVSCPSLPLSLTLSREAGEEGAPMVVLYIAAYEERAQAKHRTKSGREQLQPQPRTSLPRASSGLSPCADKERTPVRGGRVLASTRQRLQCSYSPLVDLSKKHASHSIEARKDTLWLTSFVASKPPVPGTFDRDDGACHNYYTV